MKIVNTVKALREDNIFPQCPSTAVFHIKENVKNVPGGAGVQLNRYNHLSSINNHLRINILLLKPLHDAEDNWYGTVTVFLLGSLKILNVLNKGR